MHAGKQPYMSLPAKTENRKGVPKVAPRPQEQNGEQDEEKCVIARPHELSLPLKVTNETTSPR